MDLGNHWEYIVAAYVMAAIVIATLITWVVLDYRGAKRTLADLEARGLRRRSAGQDSPP